MKKYTFVLCLLFALATFAYAVQLTISGIGIAYGADRATADQEADQNAQTNMQNQCAGVVVSSHKTGDQCTDNIGTNDEPKYMCTVGYVGTCQYGNR